MVYLVEAIIIILVIALIVTIIIYPKDVGKLVLGFLVSPFLRLWEIISLVLIPLGLLIVFIGKMVGVYYKTKIIDRALPDDEVEDQKSETN